MSAGFSGAPPNSSGIDFLPTVQRRPCGLRLRKLKEQPAQNVKFKKKTKNEPKPRTYPLFASGNISQDEKSFC